MNAEFADPWRDTLIESLAQSRVSPLGERLPNSHSLELQRNVTGLVAEGAMCLAQDPIHDMMRGATASGLLIHWHSQTPESGFECGHMTRILMREELIRKLYGVDGDLHVTRISCVDLREANAALYQTPST